MIKLTRTTEPPAGFAGEQRIEKNLAIIRLRQDGGKADSGVWRGAKAHLKEETRGKCAYCESTTSTVAYGDVEHFRPKSVYWWLAYCYDNFSYSCQLCNQMYKKASFRVARDDVAGEVRHFRASSLTSSTARNPTARASRPGSSCRRASSSARAWSCPEDIDGAVGRVLREALAQPAAGAPRRPDAIRVADSVIAAEVRAAVQGAIPVTVAPTPELDDLRAQLIESMPPGDEDESYFAGGRVSPAAVERLFTAARALFAMKPWSLVADTRLLRMDIPALNVDGASLVVTGPTSGRRGVFIFPTPEGFDTFLDVAMQQSSDIDSGPTDVAAGYLALVYERVTDLPPSMRREGAGRKPWMPATRSRDLGSTPPGPRARIDSSCRRRKRSLERVRVQR